MFKFLRKTLLWIVLIPYALTWAGTASNQAVLWANNDAFPVRINLVKLHHWIGPGVIIRPGVDPAHPDGVTMIDDVHCLMTEKTHLNWLADNFDFHDSIESVGDLMIELGEYSGSYLPVIWFALIVAKMNARKEQEV